MLFKTLESWTFLLGHDSNLGPFYNIFTECILWMEYFLWIYLYSFLLQALITSFDNPILILPIF